MKNSIKISVIVAVLLVTQLMVSGFMGVKHVFAAQSCSPNSFYGTVSVDGVATDNASVTLTDLTNGAPALTTTTSLGGFYQIESANLTVCAAPDDEMMLEASFGDSIANIIILYAPQETTPVDLDIVYTPPAPTYILTFNANGGTPTPDPITGLLSGDVVALPTEPTLTGNTFNGWFTALTGGTVFDATTPVTANITIYARWTVTPSTPVLTAINLTPTTASVVVAGTTQMSASALDQNGVAMNPQPVLTWTSDNPAIATVDANGLVTAVSAGTANVTAASGAVTSNIAVVTVTTPAATTFSVTFDANGGAPTPTTITGITSGATVTLPSAPTLAGNTFNGWFTATSGGTGFDATTPVTGNITVYAQWTQDPVATAFSAISGTLTAQHIANNLDTVNSGNVHSFSGLYFEKSIDILGTFTPVGRVLFTGALDLSDPATTTFLQNLGTELEQGKGSIALNVSTSTVFSNPAIGASLTMYNVTPGVDATKLIVRDDAGTIISSSGIVSGFSQDPVTNDVTFTASHFTKFDIDTTAPTGTIVINGGATYTNDPSHNVTLTLSGTDNVGVTQMAFSNGGAYSAWEPYSTTRLLWTLSSSGDGLKTVRVKFKDAAGNETAVGIPAEITLDTTSPTVTAPADIVQEAIGTTTPVTFGPVVASDLIDSSVTVAVCDKVSGDLFPIGSTLVTCSAADLAGNTGSASFNITVQDTTPPVITLVGASTMHMYVGGTFSDPGATATDNLDGSVTVNTGGSVDTTASGSYTLTYTATDSHGNSAVPVIRTVKVMPITSNENLLTDNTDLTLDKPVVVIGDNNTSPATINIPLDVTDGQIEVVTTDTETGKTATINAPLTIDAITSIGNVSIEIPAGIEISGSSSWTGYIDLPQIKNNSSVTVTPDSGKSAAVNSVIEIGFADVKLTFNKAVRILMADQAGRSVGYSRAGVFTSITNVCTSDSQVSVDAQLVGGIEECKKDVGSDLAVWTKHFTSFVTYTQTTNTPAPAPSDNNSGGGGGGIMYLGNSTHPVDSNSDGQIDILDFNLLMANWSITGNNITDFNGDGKVDILDLNSLMINWSNS